MKMIMKMGVRYTDRVEVMRLMELLNALYFNSPHPEKDKTRVYAWMLALSPYTYDEAKEAVLTRIKANKYYPDVSEILQYLPERAPAPEKKSIESMKKLLEKIRGQEGR